MSYIRFEKISKAYNGIPVLKEIDFRVESGDKIGLIGRNGTGKSTLFRIITGEVSADEGQIDKMKRVRIAALAQLPDVPAEKTLHDIVLEHFHEFLALEQQLEDMENRIGEGEDNVLEEYGHLQEQFTLMDGYGFRSRIKRVLCGLGFLESEFTIAFKALSGGQRTRLMLALVLLADADLLLLDEPENHLDLQAREWLESFLKDWPHALVIISHDRQMLNAVTNRIIEVERGGLRGYKGNFDRFMKEKERIRDEQANAYLKQKNYIEAEEKRIDKFRYKASKAKQAQSWIKKLDKIERIDAPLSEQASVGFALGDVVRSGQLVLEAEGMGMGFDNLPLYQNVSFKLERGERIGIIGPNGSGKTTLLKQLANRLSSEYNAAVGTVTLGPKVTMGYYDQQHEDHNSSLEMLEEFERAYPQMRREELRSFLGRFQFSNDTVFKPMNTLSGGERSRVAIAKLILSKANLLLLDEPTNHLDILSRAALEQALVSFDGSIIMVSHDRHLIDQLATKLIVVSNGQASVHLGNYTDYRTKTGDTHGKQHSDPDVLMIRKREKVKKIDSRDEQKERSRQKRRLESLEVKIATMEEMIDSFDSRFEGIDPSDFTSLGQLTEEKAGLRNDLQELYDEWENMSQSLS